MHPQLSLTLLVVAASTAAYATSPRKRSTTDPTQLSGKTFDFVIVGGGTAGLALAARLAEWTNITIAVIEAGSDGTQYQDQLTIPGMSYLDSLTGSSYDWNYTTTAQPTAGGGDLTWPRGKGLGGSSAINGGFWCRGSSAEYDAWNTLQNGTSGAEDWGWNTMQASINKAETFTPMSDANAATLSVTHDSGAHGTTGPIQSSYSSYQFSHLATWIPTLVAMGLPHVLDPANGTNVGVSFVPSIINPANGSRSDSNFGYIAPYAGTNLVILTGYQATKVNWNSTTTGAAVAGGVSFAADASSTVYTVNAAKEVILSGGTIGSPQILQVSGVGPASLLTGLGITSVVDLPGVGANLQDHLSSSLYMQATDNNTWAALKSDQTLWNQQLAIWRANGTGMWTYWNEATAYPNLANLMGSNTSTWTAALDVDSALSVSVAASSMDPTVEAGVKAQYAIQSEWASASNIGQVEIIFNMYGSAPSMIGIQFCIQHAFSRGNILITSPSVFDYPAINPNYLSVAYDAEIMRAALKYVRQVIATAPMSQMIAAETLPGTSVSADADIDSYIAKDASTEYHPSGTAAMLPMAYGGVVNTSLVVYGTTNLRVVDVSIMPMSVSAHTMATAYGIAERAADIIKAAHGGVVASNTSSSASPSSTGSGSGSGKSNDTTTKTSNLSGGAKAAIGVGAGIAALALLSAAITFFFRRRRSAANERRAIAGGKAENEAWYSDEDPVMHPRAPFMAGAAAVAGTHTPSRSSASASPRPASSISMDSFPTHADNQQRVEYGAPHYAPVPVHYNAPEGDGMGVDEGVYAGVGAHGALHRHSHVYPHPHSSSHVYEQVDGGEQAYDPYGALHSDLTTADGAPGLRHVSGSSGGSHGHRQGRYTDSPLP